MQELEKNLSNTARSVIAAIFGIFFLYTLFGAFFKEDNFIYIVLIIFVTGPLAVMGWSMAFADEKEIRWGYFHPYTLYAVGVLMIAVGIHIRFSDASGIEEKSRCWVVFAMGAAAITMARQRIKIRRKEKDWWKNRWNLEDD